MTTEQNRRFYVQRIDAEIRDYQAYIKHAQETLQRYKDQNMPGQSKIVKDIENWEEAIEQKEKERNLYLSGHKDEELEKEAEKNRIANQKRIKEQKESKKQKKENAEELLRNTRRKIRSNYSNDRKQKRDIDYEYRRYKRLMSSVPNYIFENLKKMPNNKGYIWRDIWLFGKLPEERNRPITMFEKNRNGLMVIKEIDCWETRIFHKQGKDRKQFICAVPHRRKLNLPSY